MWSLRRSLLLLVALLSILPLASCGAPGAQDYGTPPASPPAVHSHTPCQGHTSDLITLNMYYGSEKQAWIEDVAKTFNASHYVACDGPITINAVPIGSGDSMDEMLSGAIKPDIWSPAGSVWLTLANDAWRQKNNGKDLVGSGATDALSVVSSPVVIAMWKPLAEALGWPKKQIGWSDLATLAGKSDGWGAYGKGEYGAFKFGHTHPDSSNSGLDAVLAEYYAAVGKSRDLTAEDVSKSQTRDFISKIEASVTHYGESTGFFANEMFNRGPDYLSATVMYESLVVASYDRAQYPDAKKYPPVVAIYPKEGTFLSDHPFVIPQAPWVSVSKRAAAEVFADYLLDKPQQTKALQYGFRPATQAVPLAAPIDGAHGVDSNQPSNLLQVPGAQLIRQIKAGWDEQRRKVSVMLVLDRSGSMNDAVNNKSKIDAAKDGLKAFIGQLSDADQVGLTVFSDGAQVVAPIEALSGRRDQLLKTIDGIKADGKTRLYDTLAEQVDALKKNNDSTIKAVIVLTDGLDTASRKNVGDVVNQVGGSGSNSGNGLKVFSIAYGDDADKDGLTRTAHASGGEEYGGNPDNIRRVFLAISRFF